ncbi:conserved oligomeric Golgi complex subunit 1-like [Chrysoperla carnea]|uniref:conserved oligomeric Golgi complex subunit 1-like n=1 Tax=Chrysoperla carnea TaxID=189513 RepID=UPI001D0918B4|nr:conserved oligomeric Golgi complex subunit 1-like [Chrysoperla carnea]
MFISQQSDHNNQQLHSIIQQLLQQLQQLIDPFDYDVFYPHIQQAVLIAAQKTQCILGILINKPESLASMLANQMKINQHQIAPEKDAMILPISNCSNVWFPLLPVTAPLISRSKNQSQNSSSSSIQINKNTNKVEKKKVIKSSPKHSKPTDNNSSAGNLVRSGAASFLSDWFG